MKNNFSFFNKVIVRTPFLPIDKSIDINNFLEHIYLSSPNLILEIKKNNEGKLDKKERQKLTETLYKYKSRLSNRSTPFGLFAGIGMVDIGKKKAIKLPKKNSYKKFLRLDMNYLASLVRHIEQVPEIQHQLNWSINTSLYKQNKKYRYIEYYFSKSNKFHKLSAVDYTEYLEKIFSKTQEAESLIEIASCIVNENITIEDSIEFVKELISSQLLVSNLEPSITTDDILKDIIFNIKKISCKEAEDICCQLEIIQSKIGEINKSKPGIDTNKYEDLIVEIRKVGVDFEKSKLFQVDLFIEKIEGAVDFSVIKEIEEAIEFLKYFYLDFDPLEFEKEKFRSLYNYEEVSLFTVFDPENGMNFSKSKSLSPLIEGLGVYYGGDQEFKITQTDQEIFVNKLYKKSVQEKKTIVKLSEKQLPETIINTKTKKQLAPTYSSMFRVFFENGTKKIFLESVGGVSSLNLLGRFSHLDEEYNSFVKYIANKEEEILSEVVVADIVHLPEDRVGNILIRPVLHSFQIPYLSKTNVEKEFELPISDLVLSLRSNRFVLRSKRLNKEIIPRLSSAHNYSTSKSLEIYKFLCNLQSQDIIPSLGFNWGHLRSYYVYSPRVEYNNVILSLATWIFAKDDIKNIVNSLKIDDNELENHIFKWQKTYKVPDEFLLFAGDNELYINLTNSLSRKVFVNEIKRKPTFALQEYLMTKENEFVKGEDGNYAQQFVASFINKEYHIPDLDKKVIEKKATRKFMPGSEWMYFKVYAGAKTLDDLLQNEFKSLIDYLLDKQIIDKWFFIRYRDPDIHLRIRFHFTDVSQIQFVIQKLNELTSPLIKNKTIHVFQMDTYNRELERYGSNTMELSESLFFEDSKVITEFLTIIEGDSGEEIRWLFALKLIDEFLSDLQFDIDQKIKFVTQLRDSFTNEFNFQKPQRAALNNKFRDKRELINKMLLPKIDESNDWGPIFDLLIYKSESTKVTVAELLLVKEKEELEMEFNNLVSSYTHMSLNRIFVSNQRLNETAVYFILEKHYRSIKAYNPNKKPKTSK